MAQPIKNFVCKMRWRKNWKIRKRNGGGLKETLKNGSKKWKQKMEAKNFIEENKKNLI